MLDELISLNGGFVLYRLWQKGVEFFTTPLLINMIKYMKIYMNKNRYNEINYTIPRRHQICYNAKSTGFAQSYEVIV